MPKTIAKLISKAPGTKTEKKTSFFQRVVAKTVRANTVRSKIVALLLVFGVLPAAVIFGILLLLRSEKFQTALTDQQRVTAAKMIEVIERNLFERYGDVQAFGLNAAAIDPVNWGRPDENNPLIRAMNGYMTNYGLYKLMMLVGPNGDVLAVNSIRANSKPLETMALYRQNFAGAPWLRETLAGKFLEGKNGLTGTYVEQPAVNADVAKLYGEDGYVITFAAPVKDASGKVVAVWVNFADFGLVEDVVASFYKEMAADGMKATELTVLDPAGNVIVDFDPTVSGAQYKRNFDVIGKLNLVQKNVESAVRAARGENGAIVSRHARKGIEQASGYARSHGAYDYTGLGWSALVRVPVSEAFALWTNTINAMVIALAAIVAGIAAAGYFIGRRAAAPITEVTETVSKLASGDKTVTVPFLDRHDEFGAMAKAVQVFKDNAIEMERVQAEQRAAEKARMDEVAQRQREAEEKAKRMSALTQSFDKIVGEVLGTVSSATTQLQASAQSMASTAEETSQQTSTVAAASKDATASVQSAAAAAEELTGAINEIGRQVGQSTHIAQQAVEQAQTTNSAVQGLSEAASKVGEVVNLINDIASQTNLLALNATIEAARAGEAGKGFAVVASEVKTLANQTAKATEEIAAQIASIQATSGAAVSAIEGIGKTIEKINEISTTIAAAVEEQSAATQEIAKNVQRAANGTKDVTDNISSVSQAAGEVGTVATQVLAAAGSMAKEAGALKQEVEKFLSDVRAA